MSNCGSCRFWSKDAFLYPKGALQWLAKAQGFGICFALSQPISLEPDKFLFATMTGIPTPDIITKAAFGCVLHERKEES